MNLNGELVNVLGVVYDWDKYIARILAGTTARGFTKNALMEDIVVDVTGDIIMEAKDGGLAAAIAKAHEASKTDAERLRNVQGVVMQATKFRGSNAVRYRYRSKMPNMAEGVDVAARPETETLDDYEGLIIKELEKMAANAEPRLARRYLLSAKMVPAKLAGAGFGELKAAFGVKGKATMAAHIDDIQQAFVRVAARQGDETLLGAAEAA
jgi:hypothetical protein